MESIGSIGHELIPMENVCSIGVTAEYPSHYVPLLFWESVFDIPLLRKPLYLINYNWSVTGCKCSPRHPFTFVSEVCCSVSERVWVQS